MRCTSQRVLRVRKLCLRAFLIGALGIAAQIPVQNSRAGIEVGPRQQTDVSLILATAHTSVALAFTAVA